MSESENTSGISKAILGRILAVVLFVCLGSFAVIQSMSGDHPVAENPETPGDPDGEENGKKTVSDIADDASNKLSNGLANTANKITGAFEKSPAKSGSFTPPTSGFKPTTPSNSFSGSQPKAPPKSKSFNSKSNDFGSSIVVSKPAAKPPARYAQANSGIPIIGNQNGFSPRTGAPTVKSQTFGDNSITDKFGDAAKSGSNAAKKLTTNVTGAANDLLKKTNEKASNAIGSIKQNLGGGFGPRPESGSTPKSPPKSKSTFGPTGQSGFASQTSQNSTQRKFQPPGSFTQKSATFDASKNLIPSTPTNSSRSPFGDSQRSNASAQSDLRGSSRSSTPARPVSSNLANPRPTGRLGSSTPKLGSATPGALTRDIPGDRQLEGVQAPALTVEKLSPREIQVNQTADFELVVKNVGRVAAENVLVFDQVPAGTEFQGSTPQPSKSSRGRDIQWNIGTLRPGQEKRIKLQLKPTRPGEIGSVAHVTFATQASMRTLVTKPVLEIVHQAEPSHLIGDDVIFDVLVKNKGDGPAKNVVIQEDVPKQLAVPTQLESSDGSRGIEYEIGTLMPGQSKRVKLALKAANIGKLRNVMFASADGGLQARHELPLEVVAPNLVARADGPTRRFLKRNVSHEFSVKNTGTASATNVELIARLPSGLRFIDANNQGRYDSNAHSVYWSLAELARNVEARVELKTMPVEVGNQPIKFESFADLKTKSAAEQPLSVEHLVDVFFDIDDVVDPIEIGSSTSYRIRVVNQGTKAASNVQLQVDFPPGLQPTSVDGRLRHNISGQRIAFEPINSMSPGDELSIVIHGKGQSAGDHRVAVHMRTDGRTAPVSKEETTRVYSDR